MTDQYGTPRAFRQALETRLMTQAKATGVDLTGRVRTVFRVRATHPMPTELPEPPSAWRDDYLGLIEELDIGARTIEGAMAVVRPVWRICVENGR